MKENWRPGCTNETLKARADLFGRIRAFMAGNGVMEVDTPALSPYANTDPHIESVTASLRLPGANDKLSLYLHTSPEFAMKRLLANGSGSIYQICKVFRSEEFGNLHHFEFSMLEWYRTGFDQHELMDEIAALLRRLQWPETERRSYRSGFEEYLGFNPHAAEPDRLSAKAEELGFAGGPADESTLLNFLFNHSVAPNLGVYNPVFVYDYPACQAALARVREGDEGYPVAERFELFISGMEIANGFYELTDADEQRDRFKRENRLRQARGLTEMPIDETLLAALEHGLPDCAGVALGLDRLLMALTRASSINKVRP